MTKIDALMRFCEMYGNAICAHLDLPEQGRKDFLERTFEYLLEPANTEGQQLIATMFRGSCWRKWSERIPDNWENKINREVETKSVINSRDAIHEDGGLRIYMHFKPRQLNYDQIEWLDESQNVLSQEYSLEYFAKIYRKFNNWWAMEMDLQKHGAELSFDVYDDTESFKTWADTPEGKRLLAKTPPTPDIADQLRKENPYEEVFSVLRSDEVNRHKRVGWDEACDKLSELLNKEKSDERCDATNDETYPTADPQQNKPA